MSRGQTYSLPSPVTANFHHPYSFQNKPLSSNNLHIQPVPQKKAEKPLNETGRHIQEPRAASYQVAQPSLQVDRIIEALHQETSKHNETRMALQSSRRANFQLEQLLYQERTFNHALRVNVQDAEMKRIFAEGQLKAFEQQSFMIESSVPTPLPDYKSATFSPSINLTFPSSRDTRSDTSGGKRKGYFTMRIPTSKRPKSMTSPVTPKSTDPELEKELEKELEEGEEESEEGEEESEEE